MSDLLREPKDHPDQETVYRWEIYSLEELRARNKMASLVTLKKLRHLHLTFPCHSGHPRSMYDNLLTFLKEDFKDRYERINIVIGYKGL